MNYSDPFAVQASTPLSRTLRTIFLQANMQLHWPEGYDGVDYIASINQISAFQTGLTVALPDATGANEGTGMLFVNVGQYPVSILDFTGTQLTTITPGQAKYLYCDDITTQAGDWHIVVFGQGSSSADAAGLAGLGVTAIGGKLNAAYTVSMTTSDANVTVSDRAKLFAATAGSVTLNLPDFNTVGNNFFFGAHNGGSGTLKLLAPTGATIDGFTSLSLAPNESAMIFCSGTGAWFTVGYGRSTQFQFTKLVKDITSGPTITLTSAEAANKLLQFIGTPTADTTVIVPSVVGIYYTQCSYSGSHALTIKTQSGAGVSLATSDRVILYCDGTDVVSAQSVAVGTNLSIVDGALNAPAIGFAADPGTGIYRADVGTVGLVSQDQESARFSMAHSSVAGLFGVGVTAPAAQVHIKASINEALRIQGTDAFMTFYDTANAVLYGAIGGHSKELRASVADATGAFNVYIGNTEILTVNAAGITIAGTINSSSQPFAILGANTFTAPQVIPAVRSPIVQLGNVNGTVQLDLSLGSTFTATVTSATTFSFKNSPPAGQDQTVYLKVTNGGSNVQFVSGTKFNNSGVQPVMTAAGRDILAIWYDVEQTAYVVGMAYKDYR